MHQPGGTPWLIRQGHQRHICQVVWVVCLPAAGSLPPSWGALSELKTLILFNNSLSGPLPGSWSGMPAITALSLGDNQLTGGPAGLLMTFRGYLSRCTLALHTVASVLHTALVSSSCSLQHVSLTWLLSNVLPGCQTTLVYPEL